MPATSFRHADVDYLRVIMLPAYAKAAATRRYFANTPRYKIAEVAAVFTDRA